MRETETEEQIEQFFLTWAKAVTGSMASLLKTEPGGKEPSPDLSQIRFFLDSLDHHYINDCRTRAFSRAVNHLKIFCENYPAAVSRHRPKAVSSLMVLGKALGIDISLFAPAAAPSTAGFIEKRAEPRYPLVLPAQFRQKSGRRWQPSETLDLSQGGMRIKGSSPLKMLEPLFIQLSLPGSKSPLLLAGTTIWKRPFPEKMRLSQYGIRFCGDMPAVMKRRLMSFISRLIQKNLG